MKAVSAYHLFIFLIILVVLWFCKMRDGMKNKIQRVFEKLLICVLAANIAKLGCIYWGRGEHTSVFAVYVCAALFYTALMHSGAFFFELCYTITHFGERFRKGQILFVGIPLLAGSVVFLLNPFTHWAFTLDEKFELIRKPLFYSHDLIFVWFLILGLVGMFQYHKYLPKNLNKCTILLTLLLAATEYDIITSNSDGIIMSVLVVALLFLLFALLSYEQFWDKDKQMMNKLALYTYLDRCVDHGIPSTIYMIKIVGYQYFDEMEKENHLIRDIRFSLQRIAEIRNLYYVGSGRIILVVDAQDKIEENTFQEKLFKNCSRNRELNGSSYATNLDIFIMHMPEDLKSVGQLKEYLRFNQFAQQIRDMDEKVHVFRGGQLEIQKALRMKKVEDAIANAIEHKAFQIYYQPIYAIKNQEIHSAEALIRLIDPELGFIPPDEFIPIAEKNGAIMEIGLQVFESVCQFWHNEKLAEKGMQYIEINLSMEQFMDDLLCYKLQGIMEKYEIPKTALNLEITETATMYEEMKLRRQMKHMSERGFLFSLDDYGTGYSNMESVIAYPLTLVKLDKSIVWSSVENEKSYITMGNLIHMFHNLGMKIVAEGVETMEQNALLEQLGCDYIQGYLYARPITKTDFLKYIADFREKK